MASTVIDTATESAATGPVAKRFDARAVLLSFLDQGLHSLASLVLSATLIAVTEPAVFGRFIFVVGCSLVAASLHYGAIGVPILVHIRQAEGPDRAAKLAVLRQVDLRFRVTAALLVAAAAYWVTDSLAPALAGAGFVAAYLARETRRNLFYLDGDSASAARFGATCFALLVPIYAGLLYIDPSETTALLAAALATGIALVLFRNASPSPASPRANLYRQYRAAFPGAGWTIVNSAANEAQTRIHVFVIQFFRGADQLGLIEAGRIVWAPLQLLGSAWQRIAQPRIASLVEAGDISAAQRLTMVGVALMAAATAGSAIVIYLCWSLIERHLFASFEGVGVIVAGWAVFSMLMLCNWALVVFLNAAHRFRAIAMVGLAATATTLAMLSVMMFDVALITALLVMSLAQAGVLSAFIILCLKTRGVVVRGIRP